MGKGLKRSSSTRSAPNLDDSTSALVYKQNQLQFLDDAPEPAVPVADKRHLALSAADFFQQSVSALSAGDMGVRSETGQRQRSQSFTLAASASNMLSTRRNSSIKSSSDKEPVLKRPVYSPKDPEDPVNITAKLEESDDRSDSPKTIPGGDGFSSNSSDSFEAAVPPETAGMDNSGHNSSDASRATSGRRRVRRHSSSDMANKGIALGSIADLSNDSDDYFEDDDEFPTSVSSFDDETCFHLTFFGLHPSRKCGIPVNRIASCMVRYAPCFWCFPIPISATDRTVLTRLNIMSAFLALGQVVATAWLVTIMLMSPTFYDEPPNYGLTHGMAPNLWSLTGSMYSIGFFGGVIIVSNLVTLKVIQVVNLVGAIRYLWLLLYLIPFEIFFVLSLFDFYDVTEVWIKHWWLVPSMAWFRAVFCEPGTAQTLCMVPVYGEEAPYNETDWCIANYQATNCTEIRAAAQVQVGYLFDWFYNSNVGWGFVLIMILFFIVNTLERIISRPLVQKSRESNVPAWLSLPFLGCWSVGVVFRYSQSSVLSARSGATYSWVGLAYMVCGALFFISAALGWFISTFSILSSRDKRYKLTSVHAFIFLMGLTSFVLTVIFFASISYSVSIVDIPIDPTQKGEIACGVDTADSCTNCDNSDPWRPMCPEWSLEDVTRVLQTQTKGSATLAVIFFLYSFSALRFGFVLRKHVTMYQIDYV